MRFFYVLTFDISITRRTQCENSARMHGKKRGGFCLGKAAFVEIVQRDIMAVAVQSFKQGRFADLSRPVGKMQAYSRESAKIFVSMSRFSRMYRPTPSRGMFHVLLMRKHLSFPEAGSL